MVLTPDCGMGESKGSVGIVGLGLIGGSLGLDLRALGWSVQGLVQDCIADALRQRTLPS